MASRYLWAKTWGLMLAVGGALIIVGGAVVLTYQNALMDFSTYDFVDKEVGFAVESFSSALRGKKGLLDMIARSEPTLRFLRSPSIGGEAWADLARDLRQLVALDDTVSRAYVQSSRRYAACCRSDGVIPDEMYTPVGLAWHDAAAGAGGFTVTSPYTREDGAEVISAAEPIYDAAGGLLGVVGVDLPVDSFRGFFAEARLRKKGSAFLLTTDNRVIYRPGSARRPAAARAREDSFLRGIVDSRASVARLLDQRSRRWCWAGVGTVPATGWKIVLVFDEGVLLARFGEFKNELKIVGLVGIGVFVLFSFLFSERISRAESDALKSQQQYRDIFERSPIMAYTIDADGRVEAVNQAFCSITGFSPREITGMRIWEIVRPGDRKRAEEMLEENRELLTSKGVLMLRKKDGSVGSFSVTHTPIYSAHDRLLSVLGVAEDVTKERRASAELEERVREIHEINRVMIDREYRIKQLRDRVEELEEKLKGG